MGALVVNKSIVISPKEVYKSTDISYNYNKKILNQIELYNLKIYLKKGYKQKILTK
jgi:hypothetical protein